MRTHLARPLVLALLVLAFPRPCPAGGTEEPRNSVIDGFSTHAEEQPGWSVVRFNSPVFVTPALVYDSDRRRALLIGGGGSGLSNGVWSLPLDGDGDWSLLAIASHPLSPRRSLSAIYDPRRQRVIVFGGYDGSFLGDLWQLALADAPTWSRLETRGAPPPPLAASAAIYDSKRDRMILIHGNDGVAPVFRNGGVWALDLSSRQWRELSPSGAAPAPRSAHTAVYDPVGDRVLVFGGSTPYAHEGSEAQYSDELWELSLNGHPAWRRLDLPGPRPGAREEQCAVYDPGHRAMLIYAGVGTGTNYVHGPVVALHDAWALSLDCPPRWRALASSPEPAGRWGHRAIFDPLRSRMVVAGGWGYPEETIAFTTGPVVTPSAPTVAKAILPTPAAVDLPRHLGLGVTNPSRGGLWLRLDLPAVPGARLELFDIAGRRIANRALGDLGSGRIGYRWDQASHVPSGVYLLRISNDRETVKRKLVLLQ